MRRPFADAAEKGRVLTGPMATDPGDPCGCFYLRGPGGVVLRVIASDGGDWEACGLPLPRWEHVSVSLSDRCPTWDEMCFVRGLFWGPEELVVQYHPPQTTYVNVHPHTLHLWAPVGVSIPVPPVECV